MSNPYDLDELMAQTRRLAALYRSTTQHTLPVTHELSRYDAKRLLQLAPSENTQAVDFIGTVKPLEKQKVQVKGRVIFADTDENDRVAEIKPEGDWQVIVLVLFDETYEPQQILALTREDLVAHFGAKKAKWPLRLALCKKLGKLMYQRGTE